MYTVTNRQLQGRIDEATSSPFEVLSGDPE
jgi:hypothetical protein